MLNPRTGAYLFLNERELAHWARQHAGGMALSGCTYSTRNRYFTDTHGSRLFLFIPDDINRGERHRGILFDKIENRQPIDNEEMFTAWETLKVMVRPRPPVVSLDVGELALCGTCGQHIERHSSDRIWVHTHPSSCHNLVVSHQEKTDGQGLDTGSGEAPGGVTLAARSTAGRHHPQEQAESGDRRGGRAAGAEAGQSGEDAGGIQPEVEVCNHCGFVPDAHPMPGCCIHPHEVICS